MIWHADQDSRLHRHLWGDSFDQICDSISAVNGYLEPLDAKLKTISRSRMHRLRYTILNKKVIAGDLGDLETLITALRTNADAAFGKNILTKTRASLVKLKAPNGANRWFRGLNRFKLKQS